MPSRVVVTIVFALLAALHAYIGVQLLPDLPIGTAGRLLGALLLAASFALIPLSLLSSRLQGRIGDGLIWAGLLAMGLFSSLLVLTALRDLARIALSFFDLMGPRVDEPSAIAVVVLALLASLVGFLNARRRARIVDVEVPIAGLPAALHGFTIAQISDIHVSTTVRRPYLDAIVDAVNALQADLVAITGDLVDGSVARLAAHTEPLARLTARHGAYFVTGNHEYYSGAEAWTRELARLGVRVLANEHVVLEHEGAPLVVAGVNDYSAHHFDPAQRSDPARALHGAPADAGAKILLAHQPRSAPAAAAAGFDLQLSGHTHGGQFWPWNHFVRLQQPFTAGLHRLQRLWVYTSRGTGYWGPPKRLGAPSEITRLRLVPLQ
ncbi:metallophosphoesterase [Solimonas soli]|uniref:metallophosphoesterase n=1 Tax=Solimonas soli TaxID=413479 RepID=UPI0004857980|nr:metallophosphoesterase [Solimonas soli]